MRQLDETTSKEDDEEEVEEGDLKYFYVSVRGRHIKKNI